MVTKRLFTFAKATVNEEWRGEGTGSLTLAAFYYEAVLTAISSFVKCLLIHLGNKITPIKI
jgi:hypothetical protein